MAARLNTLDDLLLFIETNKIADFHIRTSRKDSNTKIFQTEDGATDAENIDRLKNVLERVSGSYFLVEDKKNGAMSVEVVNDKAITTPYPAAQIGSVPDEEKIKTEAKRMFDDWLKDRELDELRKENKELRRLAERETPMEKAFNKAEPYLPIVIQGLANKFFPAAQIGLAGIEKKENVESEDNNADFENSEELEETLFTEDEEQRVEDACVKWAQVDPKFYEVLEYLANFAASGNPVKAFGIELSYGQLREMLFSFKFD